MPTTVDPNPPVVAVDTSGVSGITGPVSSGSASTVAGADTTPPGPTGATNATPVPPAVVQPDTALAGGPALDSYASTAISGTLPTTGVDFPGGTAPANPAYQAPDIDGTPVTIADTTRTEGTSVAGVPGPTTQDYAGTLETNNIGVAPTAASGTGVPAAPTSPTATAGPGARQVTVGWTASADPSNAPVRGYYITSSRGDTFVVARGASAVVEVEQSVPVTFQVAAFNANGTSAKTAATSPAVTATPTP